MVEAMGDEITKTSIDSDKRKANGNLGGLLISKIICSVFVCVCMPVYTPQYSIILKRLRRPDSICYLQVTSMSLSFLR